MNMGFAPTWLGQVSPPLLHKTSLTTVYKCYQPVCDDDDDDDDDAVKIQQLWYQEVLCLSCVSTNWIDKFCGT